MTGCCCCSTQWNNQSAANKEIKIKSCKSLNEINRNLKFESIVATGYYAGSVISCMSECRPSYATNDNMSIFCLRCLNLNKKNFICVVILMNQRFCCLKVVLYV